MVRLTTLFCGFSLMVSVAAFSSGAPASMCYNGLDRPSHNDSLPQSTESPYKLYLNATDGMYRAGEPLSIMIHGNGRPFKGFFLKVETTSGFFDGVVMNTTKRARAVPGCGMTHSGSENKVYEKFTWNPPAKVDIGLVQFKAIVVEKNDTYWSCIRSETLRPDKYKSMAELLLEYRQMMKNKPQAMNGAVMNPNMFAMLGDISGQTFQGSSSPHLGMQSQVGGSVVGAGQTQMPSV